MNLEHSIKTVGDVTCNIKYKNGKKITWSFPNTVVFTGRQGLAQALTNTLGGSGTNQIYIQHMTFGTNGVDSGGTPKIVAPDQNSLFGVAPVATKPVNSSTDGSLPTQAIFGSTLLYGDAVGSALSCMGLMMANGNYYSIVSFPVLTKTSSMEVNFVWRVNFI
jgi:hypothetical protein